MIDYAYKDLFLDDSTTKQMIIQFDSMTITNEDLFDQNLELSESLCSEKELRFGSCGASYIKFKVANIVAPMSKKELTVKMSLNGHADELFMLGKYTVTSDVVTPDKMWREIVAFDKINAILNDEVAAWYNSILPNKDSTVPMRQFRTSFMQYFDLEQAEITLANDGMIVERTIEPEQLSGKDVITAICEINGCFGHIGRDGKFHYIYLAQEIEGLYPSPTLYPSPDLFPRAVQTAPVGAGGTYISADYKDFKTRSITKLQIRQEKNDIGVIVGSDGNEYIIEDNFLVYGKSSEDLRAIANNILDKITGIIYRPIVNVDTKGNPCLEVGDPIRLVTKHALIETYILQRTMKGIQALRDTYSANGVETYAEKVNGVHASIKQLKGKANVLERTIEETKSTITNLEKNAYSEIQQTAEKIKATVSKSVTNYDTTGYNVELTGYVDGTAEDMYYKANEHNGKYYLNQSNGNLYQSNGSAWVYVKTLRTFEQKLNAAITVSADKITQEVCKASDKFDLTKVISPIDGKEYPFTETIELFGFGRMKDSIYGKTEYNGKWYLDQNSGCAEKRFESGFPPQIDYIMTYPFPKITAQLSSKITQTANDIKSEVSEKYTTKDDAGNLKTELNNSITQTANSTISRISDMSEYWDVTGYTMAYSQSTEPAPDIGKYWLNTSNGNLYVGRAVLEAWTNLGDFNSARLSNGEYRWYKTGEGVSIYNKYGNSATSGYRPGYHMPLKGKIVAAGQGTGPSVPTEYPVGTWWMDITPGSGLINDDGSPVNTKLEYYLSDINHNWAGPVRDVMVLYEKAYDTHGEWVFVKTCEKKKLLDTDSSVQQFANKISMKVSAGDVTSQLLLEPDIIKLTSKRLQIVTDNLEINPDTDTKKNATSGVIKSIDPSTKKYVKFHTGGLEGGYDSQINCKIDCEDGGLAFRGKTLKFCMDTIRVGKGMGATKYNKVFTGDILYAYGESGDVSRLGSATLHVWNGLILDSVSYRPEGSA